VDTSATLPITLPGEFGEFNPRAPRGILARKALQSLTARTRDAGPTFDDMSALVVAPHPDDETLGCGGTIARKVRNGAEVSIAFLTDGGGSHPHLMPRERLCRLRKEEALDACAKLGIPRSRVHFLDIADGALAQWEPQASVLIAELLTAIAPDQVFVTHSQDLLSDHVAAHRIVLQAVRGLARRPLVYEYPIWLWDRWPWTNPFASPRQRHAGKPRRQIAGSSVAWRMHRHLSIRVDVRDVLATKLSALHAHQTQVVRFESIPGWLTLSDVDNGNWISNSLGAYEFFRLSEQP
jgi:LmbE family N-acetylglucosaminyl deacetylase